MGVINLFQTIQLTEDWRLKAIKQLLEFQFFANNRVEIEAKHILKDFTGWVIKGGHTGYTGLGKSLGTFDFRLNYELDHEVTSIKVESYDRDGILKLSSLIQGVPSFQGIILLGDFKWHEGSND